METSGDENFLAVVALLGTATSVGMVGWWSLHGIRHSLARRIVLASFPLAWTAIFGILAVGSAREVLETPSYFLTMVGLGVAWVTALAMGFPWLGLSLVDDAVIRKNLAAAWALAGGVLGASLIYGGSNIGEGPSLWTNLFPALVGTMAWAGLWLILELIVRPSLAIAEGRDLASGLRLGAFLVAVGLLVGRGMAGRWVSVDQTFVSLFDWLRYAGVLVAAAWWVELRLQPRRSRPFPQWRSAGLGPALVYIGYAVVLVLTSGPWHTLVE